MLTFLNAILKPIHLERICNTHPYVFYMIMMVGMPLFLLISVGLATFTFMTAISFLVGWI